MKILFIIPYMPDLIRTRPYNLLRGLARQGHSISLAMLYSNSADLDHLDEMRQLCAEVIALPLANWRGLANTVLALPTRMPLQMNYCWQPELARRILQLEGQARDDQPFDIIHVEHLRGVKYALHLQSHWQKRYKGEPHPPIVWDSVDSISLLFSQSAQRSRRLLFRWLSRLDLRRTEQAESWLPGRFQRTLLTSRVDRDHMLSLAPAGENEERITVLPNGVDCEYFAPGPESQRQPDMLVVSGKMSYHANVSMVLFLVERIMPQVWQRFPQARLWVVGKDPTPALRALHNPPQVTVTGTVPDMRPYLQQAAVCLAPLQYGAGIQNKVLEAMACATPVVASPQAVSALDVQEEQQVLVGQDEVEITDKIVSLLSDIRLRQAVGLRGREFVLEQYDWAKIAARLEGIYDDTIRAN